LLCLFLIRSCLCPGRPQQPSYLHSLQLGWQTHTTMPSFYWLRWGLMNFLPRLASASRVARITGKSPCADKSSPFLRHNTDLYWKCSDTAMATVWL
jgi:hypothetical protein